MLDAALVATRQADNLADRAAYEAASVVDDIAWDGPGVHPGRTITTLRRVLPDDAILTTDAGNFARLGWSWLPVPQAGHLPRADLRRDGLRAAGGDRRRPRPSRSRRSWRSSATAASA